MSQYSDHVFPPDHPVHALRGARKLIFTGVRRMLRGRLAWLTRKVAERTLVHQNTLVLEEELAALVQVLELLEDRKGACGHPCEVCPGKRPPLPE